jgi:integrase
VLSRKTVVQVLITIFGILEYAGQKGILVSKVSLKDLKLGKVQKGRPSPFFTHSQAMRIIAMAKQAYKTLFAIAWYTGARAGELLALTIGDLDFERKTITIDETCDDNNQQLRSPKTIESNAMFPLSSALEAILRNYL